jgi:hypothetical protein
VSDATSRLACVTLLSLDSVFGLALIGCMEKRPDPTSSTDRELAADQFAAQVVKSAMNPGVDGLHVFDDLERRLPARPKLD